MLWSIGIRHNDISEGNMMVDKKTNKAKLCDFDLSHLATPPDFSKPEEAPIGPTGFTNTGTWVFMANELLSAQAMDGNVKRIYFHDVESLVAVLLWVTCRYKEGELVEQNPLPFEHWKSVIFERVLTRRRRTYDDIRRHQIQRPLHVPDWLWKLLASLIPRLVAHLNWIDDAHGRDPQMELDIKLSHLYGTEPPAKSEVEEPFIYEDLRTLERILKWHLFARAEASRFIKILEREIVARVPGGEFTHS